MTGYVADLSWKSGARAIEKLDRLKSTMAVNVLIIGQLQAFLQLSLQMLCMLGSDHVYINKTHKSFALVDL